MAYVSGQSSRKHGSTGQGANEVTPFGRAFIPENVNPPIENWFDDTSEETMAAT